MDLRWIIAIFVACSLSISRATKMKGWLEDHQKSSTQGQNQGQALAGTNDNTRSNTECLATQRKFVDLKVGEASLTINSKTHDDDMRICYSGYKFDRHKESCCTHTMERLYMEASARHFHQTLNTSSSYFCKLLVDNAKHYQALFLQLLSGAHNKTERLFSEVYHLPLMDRWGPTESLFLDLQAYLKLKDVSIHKSIERFFDELFPLVFHNNVNDPRISELNDDYRECLMEARRDVRPPPFGGVPTKLAHQLAHSFSSARAFLDALRMGAKVVNTTVHLSLSPSCQSALTRLQFCGHCDGHVDIHPCRGYCYNVMRGCFAHVTDINVHWNEMLDSLELLTVNMRGSNDIEDVLHSFHTKISEAIMHAMETGVKYNHKVNQTCGHLKTVSALRDLDQKRPVARPDPSVTIPTPIDGNTRLFAKIEMFMRNVVAAKGFLSHLPDTMCTEERFSAVLDAPCWNGDDVSPYNKSIMTKDLAAQIHNPEVTVDTKPDTVLVELTKQIKTLKSLLQKKVNLDRMQGDAAQSAPGDGVHGSQIAQGDDPNVYFNYGGQKGNHDDTTDGSGDWYNNDRYNSRGGYGYYDPPQDDEDSWNYYGYSGSGSGAGPDGVHPIRTSSKRPGQGYKPETEFTFDDRSSKPTYSEGTPQPPYNNVGVPPSSAERSRASLLVVLMLLVLWMYERC